MIVNYFLTNILRTNKRKITFIIKLVFSIWLDSPISVIIWKLKSTYFCSIKAVINNPPIKLRFKKRLLILNGNIIKKIVVGIRNNNKKIAPIFWSLAKMNKPEPNVSQMIATIKAIEVVGAGITFDEI